MAVMAPGIPASNPAINYTLKSKVVITLRLVLCSICHTALQACKKLLCLNPVTTEIAGEKSKGSSNLCSNDQSRSENEVHGFITEKFRTLLFICNVV